MEEEIDESMALDNDEEVIMDNDGDDEEMDNDNDEDYEDIEESNENGEEAAGTSKDNGKEKEKKKKKVKATTFLPGMKLKQGEKLVCDETCYTTLHEFSTADPCLSFDIIKDSLGDNRSSFPLTSFAVAGTQAERSHANNLLIMKLDNVFKTLPKSEYDELSSDESEGEEETEKTPELNVALVPHHGCVNRVRFNYVNERPLAVTWSELGKVCLWDLSQPLEAVKNNKDLQEYIKTKERPKPIFNFKGHRGEGFAIDWSPVAHGVLASGDSTKFIHVWRPRESTWEVDKPFDAHNGSVEDIQWSPSEQHVFASCSIDKSIRIWDSRVNSKKACIVTRGNAHENDINVIHWNRLDTTLLASGSDDCALKIWDLRVFSKEEQKCVAEFKKHHKMPICSVEWSPHESSMLASVGEDDQIAIWDLSLEKDTEALEAGAEGEGSKEENLNVPEQLIFVHQGQKDIKEVHWHPQIPGVLISTSASGFNIFKPVNC